MNTLKHMCFAILGLGVMAMGDVIAHVADRSTDLSIEAGALVLLGVAMVFIGFVAAVRS